MTMMMCAVVVGRLLLLLLLVAIITTVSSLRAEEDCGADNNNNADSNVVSPYVIILDGGSTGSRLHIFEYLHDDEHKLERRGSTRVDEPLSSFAVLHAHEIVNKTAVVEHLIPLFLYAQQHIPEQFHTNTLVHYAATAGMRLLSNHQQVQVYDAMYLGLIQDERFVFNIRIDTIQTLSGDLEGYYGAIAANYLRGTCRANLELVHEKDRHTNNNNIVGALDMGGSSTQIVYHVGGRSNENDEEDGDNNAEGPTSTCGGNSHGNEEEMTCMWIDAVEEDADTTNNSGASTMQHDQFFAESYLSYGVDQFRERLWNLLIAMEEESKFSSGGDDDDPVSKMDKQNNNVVIIGNPCGNVHHEDEYRGYTLRGTGDTESCQKHIQSLLSHPHNVVVNNNSDGNDDDVPYMVGGVEHPEIPDDVEFLAMSLYFFSMDAVRHFTQDDVLQQTWPNPTLQELEHATSRLCGTKLQDLVHLDPHPYTRPQALQHRCLEALYMITLLRDGFGFNATKRQIMYTFETNGSEVEWTLGMALLHFSSLYDDDMDDENAALSGSGTCSAAAIMDEDDDDDVDETKNNQNVTFWNKQRRWVQMVAQVLVSDGELVSVMTRVDR